MRRSPRTRLFTATVGAVAVLALAACGDDDGDDTSSTTDTEVAADTVDTTEAPETDGTSGTSVVGTTATSGGGEVGAREDYVEAATAAFPADDEELAGCVAEALISDEVYAQIEDLGVTADQFEGEGPEGAGITLDEELATMMAVDVAACGELADAVLESEDARACAAEHLSNEQFAQYVTFRLFSVQPGDDLQAAFDATDECVNAAGDVDDVTIGRAVDPPEGSLVLQVGSVAV